MDGQRRCFDFERVEQERVYAIKRSVCHGMSGFPSRVAPLTDRQIDAEFPQSHAQSALPLFSFAMESHP